jgi:hypothetical protein
VALEPRTPPASGPDTPAANVAVQAPGNTQPTNKVAAATNWGGTAGGAIAGIVSTFGSDSIHELWVIAFGTGAAPMTEKIVSALIIFAVCTFATRYLGRVAAYNVLDKPNVAMAPVTPPSG